MRICAMAQLNDNKCFSPVNAADRPGYLRFFLAKNKPLDSSRDGKLFTICRPSAPLSYSLDDRAGGR
jgi:hypothetical protein